MKIIIDNLKVKTEIKKSLGNGHSRKQVTKFLQTTLSSSSADNADLRITGLVVGKTYKVYSQAYFTSSASSGASMFVKHNGTSLHRYNFDSSASNFSGMASGHYTEFVATNTEINVDFSLGASTQVIGNSSLEGTWVKCIELDYNVEEVSSF